MKLSRILLACLVAAAGTSAFAAKFNLKMGHAVNATDGQHAAATDWLTGEYAHSSVDVRWATVDGAQVEQQGRWRHEHVYGSHCGRDGHARE